MIPKGILCQVILVYTNRSSVETMLAYQTYCRPFRCVRRMQWVSTLPAFSR